MVAKAVGAQVLRPLGAVTRVVAARRRRRARPRVRVAARVVSVGNLVVGGTGKTPMVACLANMLAPHLGRVGVVTGAYGPRPHRRRAAGGARIRADLARGPATAQDAIDRVGDEAVMLADALPEAIVVAGRPKSLAAQWLVHRSDVDCVIVDDAFQHHALARDIDIVLLHGPRPFASGRVLPAGRLREGPAALRHADIVVFTGGEPSAATRVAVRSLSPDALTLTGRHAVAGLRDETGSPVEPSALNGVEALGVCGLGSPASFERTLAELGARAEFMRYTDHHAYSDDDLRRIHERASARAIVTTAKDATKWHGRAPFRYVVVDVEMQVDDADALLARLVDSSADPD